MANKSKTFWIPEDAIRLLEQAAEKEDEGTQAGRQSAVIRRLLGLLPGGRMKANDAEATATIKSVHAHLVDIKEARLAEALEAVLAQIDPRAGKKAKKARNDADTMGGGA